MSQSMWQGVFRLSAHYSPLTVNITLSVRTFCLARESALAQRNFRLGSGKKKEPKPKLCGPDIFRWGRGLLREGVGAKKFGMSFETQGSQTFWRDIRDICWDIPAVPERFEKKSSCSIWAPIDY